MAYKHPQAIKLALIFMAATLLIATFMGVVSASRQPPNDLEGAIGASAQERTCVGYLGCCYYGPPPRGPPGRCWLKCYRTSGCYFDERCQVCIP